MGFRSRRFRAMSAISAIPPSLGIPLHPSPSQIGVGLTRIVWHRGPRRWFSLILAHPRKSAVSFCFSRSPDLKHPPSPPGFDPIRPQMTPFDPMPGPPGSAVFCAGWGGMLRASAEGHNASPSTSFWLNCQLRIASCYFSKTFLATSHPEALPDYSYFLRPNQ